nr:PilI type IV pilus biogenesis protein [Escherichia coli]
MFSTKTPTDPDELARRFCTPDNCLVGTTRQRFLFRLERAPQPLPWHKAAAPAISIYRTGYMNATEAKCYSMVCDDQELHFLFQRIKQLILLSLLFSRLPSQHEK